MQINNSIDLLNVLKYLIPDAKCSVWETQDISQYHGETEPLIRFNMFVDWRSQESCPTEEEITALDGQLVETALENARKQAKYDSAKQNLAIIAAYQQLKTYQPDLTWESFIDQLTALQGSV